MQEVQQKYSQVNVALVKISIDVGTDAEQAKTNVLEAAKKLVMMQYAGHSYFFKGAGWAKTAYKLRSQNIEKVKSLCINEIAAAATTAETEATAASCEYVAGTNPYAPVWTANVLNCHSEWAGIYSLSKAGRDGLDRPAVQEMSTGPQASNSGQQFQLHVRKY